jgi:flagellar protein FliO/FliZ
MTQSLITVIVFVVLLACLPWAVSKLKSRYGLTQLGPTQQSRVLSVLAVGPHQKVVTVEVGPEHARAVLVLGVTPQSVRLLHTLPNAGGVAAQAQQSNPPAGLVGP